MSHFTRVSTKISRKSALIKALLEMGFKEHMIEVSDKPLQLKGYMGDFREGKQGHIRIKGHGWGSSQNHVGGMSNDLGFERMEDGTYAFHVSNYDVNKYNKKWQEKLLDRYAQATVHEIADERNYFIDSEEHVDGGIKLKLRTLF